MLRTTVAMMGFALALCACGDDGGVVDDDAGTGAVDSGVRADSSTPRRDGGPRDECAASQAASLSTLGCNGGFVSGEPAPNEPSGTCTPGGEAMPAGTCTTPNALCAASEGATEGDCLVFCDLASTYVSTGECPMGYRCFVSGEEYGLCYRDCDATHPCPTGQECDGEGSCIPGDEPEVDGGVADGGMADGGADDGGMADAGVEDAGAEDAGVDAAVPAK